MFFAYSGYSSPGEAFLVGTLTAITFGIVSAIVASSRKKKEKKQQEEDEEKERQEKVMSVKNEIAHNHERTLFIGREDYSDLYETLKRLCNPAEFMNPYDPDMVQAANEIYSKLDCNKDNVIALIDLRNQAIQALGISVSSKRIYDKLEKSFSPTNFMGDNYDSEKLTVANDVYRRIVDNKDNIIKLEEIAKECGIFKIGKAAYKEKVSERGSLSIADEDGSDNASNNKGADLLTNAERGPLIFLAIIVLALAIAGICCS